jgi:hypothetical protein
MTSSPRFQFTGVATLCFAVIAEYLIEHGKIDGVAVERLFPV